MVTVATGIQVDWYTGILFSDWYTGGLVYDRYTGGLVHWYFIALGGLYCTFLFLFVIVILCLYTVRWINLFIALSLLLLFIESSLI